MADEILNEARARGEIANEDGEIWNLWRSPGGNERDLTLLPGVRKGR
jgi:hypothetical protein